MAPGGKVRGGWITVFSTELLVVSEEGGGGRGKFLGGQGCLNGGRGATVGFGEVTVWEDGRGDGGD